MSKRKPTIQRFQNQLVILVMLAARLLDMFPQPTSAAEHPWGALLIGLFFVHFYPLGARNAIH